MYATLCKIVAVLMLVPASVFGQFGHGSEWHKNRMSQKEKIQHSRMWKAAGLTMMSTGIYIGRTNSPQRIDVPLIGFGLIITIEGIRLRKDASSKGRETIF